MATPITSHPTSRRPSVRLLHMHGGIIALLTLAAMITACSADPVTGPMSQASLTPSASHGGGSGGGGGGSGSGGSGSGGGGGGGGGQLPLPVAPGPLSGVWAGQETWETGVASWTVQVNQDSGSTSLTGSAVTNLQLITSPNRTMGGVVIDSTHVTMFFTTPGGKPGRASSARVTTANLTLSADGRTLSGPITPFEPGITTTLTLRR